MERHFMSAVEPVSCYSAAVANGNCWYIFSTFPKFQKLEAVCGLGMFCFWRAREEVLHLWVALLQLQYKADNGLWELTAVELSLGMK